MSNGLKFNPAPMESIIQDDPHLTGALIFGQGKAQAALLVEPRNDVDDHQELIARIWSTVERANTQGPGQARINRSMILIASPGKRFIRAPKGSVVRKLTINLYTSELENLYSQEPILGAETGPVLTATYGLDNIRRFVASQVHSYFPSRSMEAADDFYVRGLDSVKTVELAGLLRAGIRRSCTMSDLSWLSNRVIYTNSTIDKLSQVIYQHLNTSTVTIQSNGSPEDERIARMKALVEKHSEGLPPRVVGERNIAPRSRFNVLLIGSTGSIGPWLLHGLLQSPVVGKITCLDRSADAKKRHQAITAQRKLDINVDDPRCHFLSGGLQLSHFGLSDADFDSLSLELDFVIHNAWTVDFNQSLESFEHVHLRGLRNIIDLCLSSAQNTQLFFISSVAAVSRWAAIHGSETPVPEAPITSSSLAANIGYAESKSVAEQILDIAHSHSGLSRSILRLGNIAGPLKLDHGSWNERVVSLPAANVESNI